MGIYTIFYLFENPRTCRQAQNLTPKISKILDLTKSTQTWLKVWEKWANERKFNPKLEDYEHEDLDKKLQMFYAEVRSKDGFFHNFVENITNKKSYDPSFIS